jgi:hypothetical protein
MFDVFDDDMYWVFNDIKYVIQANNEFGLDKEIPLRIHKNEVDLCVLKLMTWKMQKNTLLFFIEDNLTWETHDITNQPFEINFKQVSDKTDFNALCRKF